MPLIPSPRAQEHGHLCATKSFLIKAIQAYGAAQVIVHWTGTDDEAIAAVVADPREVIALGCDHYDDQGYCLGHERSKR